MPPWGFEPSVALSHTKYLVFYLVRCACRRFPRLLVIFASNGT